MVPTLQLTVSDYTIVSQVRTRKLSTKLNFPGICNMIKLSNINSVIWVFFIDPCLVFIFGLISYPLTIYAYTALWYFSRHNSIYTFFGNKFKSNFLVFFLWLFQAWIVFLEIWKSKKTKTNFSKVPQWFNRNYWQTSFH